MPELPEVETIVRDLRPLVIGRAITGLILREKAINHLLQATPEAFYQGLMNQTIVTVLRKGKYIILPLDNGNVLVFHLGMTGKLLIQESTFGEQLIEANLLDKHTHILMELSDPSEELEALDLQFNDVRLFGNVWLLEGVDNIEKLNIPGLRELGPDALGITLSEFEKIMNSRRANKVILLDQSKMAGVGNIYADEACFSAGVHPSIKGVDLTEEQLARLWFAVKSVLKQGIKHRGSSVSDYVSTDGKEGSFQKYHRVYQKTGQPCVQCSSEIQKIKLGGRSTHFCPECQQSSAKGGCNDSSSKLS